MTPPTARPGTCDCPDPWLDPDDDADWCWRCGRPLPDETDDEEGRDDAR